METVWITLKVELADDKWIYNAKKKSEQEIKLNVPISLVSEMNIGSLIQELVVACLFEYKNLQEDANPQ